MAGSKTNLLEMSGYVLVLLMAFLQAGYALFAYIDPAVFSVIRGTELLVSSDSDWVKIYASRTLFVALIIGFLLYLKNYRVLAWAAFFGMVMPVTDALLAYQSHTANTVVYKHIATIVYLLITFFVLQAIVKNQEDGYNGT